MKDTLIVLLLFLMSFSAFAQSKVAVVKMLRGDVDVLMKNKKATKLKVDDWVENGATIKTADKSFVKLIFIDKSQMNIGPQSEMKIENVTNKESGVIDLVKGKIRSTVTKDYLQIKDKDKSKLFIKTSNAVMGVRGTDFMISTNGQNTSTVLFEGEIVFNKLEHRGETSVARLEEIVDRGVRIHPGEFSVMEANRPAPTVPSLINIQQKEQLEKNTDFSTEERAPGNAKDSSAKSIVPEGLSGNIVSNDSGTLKNAVVEAVGPTPTQNSHTPPAGDANGFIKGDQVKPANGSFVHIDSGVIIPPGPGSVLDANTNTFIPGKDAGRVGPDGSYIPPKNVEITNDGKIMVSTVGANGAMQIKEVAPPPPVVHPNTAVSGGPIGIGGSILPPPPGGLPLRNPAETPFMNMLPPPSGGIQGVNDPQQSQIKDETNTTIRIKPDVIN